LRSTKVTLAGQVAGGVPFVKVGISAFRPSEKKLPCRAELVGGRGWGEEGPRKEGQNGRQFYGKEKRGTKGGRLRGLGELGTKRSGVFWPESQGKEVQKSYVKWTKET